MPTPLANTNATNTLRRQWSTVLLVLFIAAVPAAMLHQLLAPTVPAWIDIALHAFLVAVSCYILQNLLNYYTPEKSRQVFLFIWSAGLATACIGIHYFGVKIYFGSNAIFMQSLLDSTPLRAFIVWQLLSAVGFFAMRYQQQQQQLAADQGELASAQLAKDAELYKLRQQMQPHFLFNSLNSINALVGSEPKQARRMIQQLSDYLRATLKKEEKELTTLAEEIKYLALYLEIEKVRFGHRLTTSTHIPEAMHACTLPVLLLQPVLENAIKFGLYNTTDAVHIGLEATLQNAMLCVSITNPYDEATFAQHTGTGFGLKAVQRRLHLHYGTYQAVVLSKNEKLFTAKIYIPQQQIDQA